MKTAIADCGGSKIEWRWHGPDNRINQKTTTGFNYQLISPSNLEKRLVEEFSFLKVEGVEILHFYGAGLSNLQHKESLQQEIARIYPHLEKIQVEDDLLAACRASCLSNPGICAILGTGSNAARFDGSVITEKMPSLGYILGDEGSGAHLGRQIIKAYAENEIPSKLKDSFERQFNITSYKDIVVRLYKEEEPSKYLASFAPFVSANIQEPLILNLFIRSIEDFLGRSILKFKEAKELPINFVGNFAFHNQAIINKIIRKNGLISGKFLQSPIAGLSIYHKLTNS